MIWDSCRNYQSRIQKRIIRRPHSLTLEKEVWSRFQVIFLTFVDWKDARSLVPDFRFRTQPY
jgi:transposase